MLNVCFGQSLCNHLIIVEGYLKCTQNCCYYLLENVTVIVTKWIVLSIIYYRFRATIFSFLCLGSWKLASYILKIMFQFDSCNWETQRARDYETWIPALPIIAEYKDCFIKILPETHWTRK